MAGSSATATTAEERRVAGKADDSVAVLRIAFSVDPAAQGRCIALREEHALAVGRQVEPGHLKIDDSLLSRVHFRIVWDERQRAYRVGDAGSTNGTFANGDRISTVILHSGDLLRAGHSLFLFETRSARHDLDARFQAVAISDLTVLITGETGTGKEVIARRMHAVARPKRKFVAVNCATLPRDLVASELFGHKRGAFSGAVEARAGVFRAAEEGTLFLDEIGDLPLDLQPALLRALQERAVRPLGGDIEVPFTARVLAATNRDLEQAVRSAQFREDLWARLRSFVLRLPPLRERRHEIIALLQEFLDVRRNAVPCSADAAEALILWSWPFNVRELEALAKTFLAVRAPQEILSLDFLQSYFPEVARPLSQRACNATERSGDQLGPRQTRDAVLRLLEECNGNVSLAARKTGKPRAQIYRWLKRFGIATPARRARPPRAS